MKTKLLLPFALLLISLGAFAQCTPDPQYTAVGIYPDTITNLPHAYVGVAYTTTITAVVPADTSITNPIPLTLSIDYYQVDSVDGLPTGFTYSCVPANCQLPGGQESCMLLECADPQLADVGTHPLIVYVTASLQNGGFMQPATITGYKMVVDNTVGIEVLNENVFDLAQNIPNPSTGNTLIRFTTPREDEMELNIYNASGQLVVHKKLNAKRGLNEVPINTLNLADGIYVYTLNNGHKLLNKRMVVANK